MRHTLCQRAAAIAGLLVVTACSPSDRPSEKYGAGTPQSGSTTDTDIPASQWAASTFGTFEPITISGSGEHEIELPPAVQAASAYVIDIDYRNASTPLIVVTRGESGRFVDALLDSRTTEHPTGPYSETVWVPWNINPRTTLVVDEADGDWTFTLRPAATAQALPEHGIGRGVYLYDGIGSGGGTVVTISPSDTAFRLRTVTPAFITSTEDLVIPAGHTSDAVDLPTGPALVLVTHDTDWRIDEP